MIAGRGDRRGHTRSLGPWCFVLGPWSLVQEPSTEDGPSTRTDQAPRTRDEGLVRRRSGSRHRARENVDLRDIRPAARAVAASRDQIDEADLIDLGQVGAL